MLDVITFILWAFFGAVILMVLASIGALIKMFINAVMEIFGLPDADTRRAIRAERKRRIEAAKNQSAKPRPTMKKNEKMTPDNYKKKDSDEYDFERLERFMVECNAYVDKEERKSGS